MRWSPVKSLSYSGIGIRLVLILISIFCLSIPGISVADEWARPSVREYKSSNGNYVVVVEPASKGNLPTATVYWINKDDRTVLWTTNLVNSVAPIESLVTDDGRYVITLDDWHSVGYGDNVIVFYNQSGMIKRYSLEEAASEFVKEKKLNSFRQQFEHSVSSRWWRAYSIIHIDESGDFPQFGIWLNWTQGWMVWRLDTGEPIPVNESEKLRWNTIGRKWSHENLANDKNAKTACFYLAYLRNPEDRGLLEHRLKSKDYSISDASRFPIRQAADRALAFWDGLIDNCIYTGFNDDELFFLGEVNISVQLPSSPQQENSQLALMIYAGNWQGQFWEQAKPEYKMCRRIKEWKENNGDKQIQFHLRGIMPGNYWIKALWDTTPPFKYDFSFEPARKWVYTELPDLSLSPGDFESHGQDTFTVQARQKVEVTVECTLPVEPYTGSQ
jgi:hypothetical protein